METKKNLTILVVALLLIAMSGCKPHVTQSSYETSELLYVEQQTFQNNQFPTMGTITVDLPVAGPSPLKDSVMELLNHEVYDYFESISELSTGRQDPIFAYEAVCTNDAMGLLQHYFDKYTPFLGIDESRWLSIQVIAQTESFVTYGVENYHCGTSCGSTLYCHTFAKSDGHRVKNIISKSKLCKFIKRHPDSDRAYSDWVLKNKKKDLDLDHTVGLMEGGILCVNEPGNDNPYSFGHFYYDDILPYLSQEAQQLSDARVCDWTDWHLGQRIASVTTKSGKQIYLAEGYTASFNEYDSFDDYVTDRVEPHNDYRILKAYSIENGSVTLQSVFHLSDNDDSDYDSVINPNWDDVNSSYPSEHIYAFNPKNNTLYVPLAEHIYMGEHSCNDRFEVYQFDGEHFEYKNVDGGFWLHPSIRKFGRLRYLGENEDFLVRIDEMRIYNNGYDDQFEAEIKDTCRYRYSAWNDDKKMGDKPSLIIENGYYSEGCFVFENNGYTYLVDDEMGVLSVFHGKENVLYDYLKSCLWDDYDY